MPEIHAANAQRPTDAQRFIALAVGNTRSRIGLFLDGQLEAPSVFGSSEHAGIAAHAVELADRAPGEDNPGVVIAGVYPAAIDAIEVAIRQAGLRTLRFGRDMPIPIEIALDADGMRTVGQDRLLCALGAYAGAGQACVVVDLGTALTVDFVDGSGVFQGGAIAPGITMMLEALAERTAALPRVPFETPDESAVFGKNTPGAMRLGVSAMARGAVRYLAERYADYYEAYPRIVATGGDMGVLEEDGLIENFVPDLQLIGMRQACRRLIELDAGGADDGA